MERVLDHELGRHAPLGLGAQDLLPAPQPPPNHPPNRHAPQNDCLGCRPALRLSTCQSESGTLMSARGARRENAGAKRSPAQGVRAPGGQRFE